MGGTEAPCSGCWWSWIHHSSLGTPMSGSLVTREMTRGAWGPIVRDEESTDGHPQPQQTPPMPPPGLLSWTSGCRWRCRGANVFPLYFLVDRPRVPLFRCWVRPLPRPKVALQVLEAEWREVGADPLPDPPLAICGVQAPGAAELVPVVLSPDPPAGRGLSAAAPPRAAASRGPQGSGAQVRTSGGAPWWGEAAQGARGAHEESPSQPGPGPGAVFSLQEG